MNEYIIPSIIAAGTSLIISIITLIQYFRSHNAQQEQFSKALNRDLTNKLYDLRLKHYPKAFDIVDSIYKQKGSTYEPLIITDALNKLNEWKTGTVSLIISVEASQSFHALREVLKKNPEQTSLYSDKQTENITVVIKEFKKQLRRDIGFLFREEKQRRHQK